MSAPEALTDMPLKQADFSFCPERTSKEISFLPARRIVPAVRAPINSGGI
jgi:hypothetical protein